MTIKYRSVSKYSSPLATITSSTASGTAHIFVFLIMANANIVFAGNLLQSLHPFTFLFWGFFAATLVFLFRLIFINGSQALMIARPSIGPLLALNVTSAVNWFGYFYALRFIEPAIVAAIFGGIGPLSIIGLERVIRQQHLPPSAYGAAVGILCGTLLLAWASVSGQSGLKSLDLSNTLIGLTAAIIGGSSQAMTVVAIKQLGDRGWNASQIMAHRFYLLVLLALVFALKGPGLYVSPTVQVFYLAVATVLGIITPLWALQRGIILSEPFFVASLLSLAPLLAYLFQGFDARIAWSTISAMGCMMVVFFTFISLRLRYIRDLP